ncbi:MAG: flavodoxin-dependent (E)-4-hydroxy-3-methylbut-2-enyl-diphosphate synthase, partial [Oscillospiraceae bacterium]|nr:flavodoxin-dependent (E)-4-hydroxy-3-methylbut-2-enyl-diphosphate synthase [Oscillospiraceae bacterium]
MTREVRIGNIVIGGDNRIAVQSMLNLPPDDVEGNVAQAIRLQQAGCDINRVAVPDFGAVGLIGAIKDATSIPIVADIHFDYRLAIKSVEAGADKIRFNPGNIGGDEKAKQVIDCCRAHGVPIRVGVNSGSPEKELLRKYGGVTSEALFESAERHVRLIEDCGYDRIVISMKASDVKVMVGAYRLMADKYDYPLHLGVTEAGTIKSGTVKSAIGIGALLVDGIGDTIRVSLT